MQPLLGAENLQAAVRQFDIDMQSHGLIMMEVAIRWIVHYSAVQDGIIIGGSKRSHFEKTASIINKGPLPEEILEVVDAVWEKIKEIRMEII
ncbi:MAG: hypothetical protein Q9169_007794 [Polycauliona sp. 2 TL-2023]